MKQIKPYTDSPTCPKCNTRLYVKNFRYCNGKDCKTLEPTYPGGMAIKYPPEHLHCTCPQCGYVELMECADAKPEEDKPANDMTVMCVCPHCDKRFYRSVRVVYDN